MKARRFLWPIILGIAIIGFVALIIPRSPIYLPDLAVAGGVYDGQPTRYWIKTLNSPDPEQRKQAIRAVASIGQSAEDAIPTLGTIMTEDPDRELRNEAALALSKMTPASKKALPALIKAVEDPEAPVRMNAVNALFRLRTEARPSLPTLVKALNDENNLTNIGIFHHNIQEMCALAIGRASAGTTEGLPPLIEFLKRANTSMMKEAAVRAIGEIGPEARSAETLLIPLLKDRNKQVRETAAEALAKIGAEVPDVGPPPPPTKPPPGIDPSKMYPMNPKFRPNAEDQNRRNSDDQNKNQEGR